MSPGREFEVNVYGVIHIALCPPNRKSSDIFIAFDLPLPLRTNGGKRAYAVRTTAAAADATSASRGKTSTMFPTNSAKPDSRAGSRRAWLGGIDAAMAY